jgi:hypothetical protein
MVQRSRGAQRQRRLRVVAPGAAPVNTVGEVLVAVAAVALLLTLALWAPVADAQKSPYKSVVEGTVPEPTVPPGCDYRNVYVCPGPGRLGQGVHAGHHRHGRMTAHIALLCFAFIAFPSETHT